MNTQSDLFDICASHHQGNAHSIAANRATAKNMDRAKIVAYLRTVTDATCDEVEVALAMSHQTCSARFSELKRNLTIEPSAYRKTRTGCIAQAWRLAK